MNYADIFLILYEIPIVHQAFDIIFIDKIVSDGYVDLSTFIYARIHKQNMLQLLIKNKSKYAVLYKSAFPSFNDIVNKCQTFFDIDKNNNFNSIDMAEKLSTHEAIAIINWIYRSLEKSNQREAFTKSVVKNVKKLIGISHDIKLHEGVVYNAKKIDLHIISSFTNLLSFVSSLQKNKNKLYFYRGHANSNYRLLPSVMRTSTLKQNESILYKELLINCPKDFVSCHTHLEKLVKMQHYGLPTRLLDITRNILVALFFACESEFSSYGELVLIEEDRNKIKYPQSDTVSILSSLPMFSYKTLSEYYHFAKKIRNEKNINGEFNRYLSRLISEIRLEKPAFESAIIAKDILDSYVVYAEKNNDRIIKQDGAFILCGLDNQDNFLEKFRYKIGDKKVIILIKNKQDFLAQLETFSINRATLFPEIDFVSGYLKQIYS